MRNKILVITFYLIISLCFFGKILMSPGLIIGGDWGLPETFTQMRTFAVQGMFIWRHNTESLFGLAASNLNDYPFRLFVGGLPIIGVNGEILTKFLLVFLFTFAGYSIYSYCRFLKINEFASALAGFFFITTPLFFNYSVMGWQFVLLALGLFPLALMNYELSIRTNKLRYAIITGLIYSLAVLQSQAIIWYPLAFIILSVFITSSKVDLLKCLKFLIIIFLIFLAIHICWILPLLFSKSSVIAQAVSQYDISRFASRLNMLNLLRLWGSLFNYQYESAFFSYLIFLSFVPAIVAYFALILRKKDKRGLYFAILSLLPLLFYLGRNVLLYIPFSNVIRDCSRNIVFSTFSYPILIAMTIDALINKRNKLSFNTLKFSGYKNILGYTLIILIVLNSYPFWTGELYGKSRYGYDIRLRTLRFPKEYYTVEKMLTKKKIDFKVLYLPMGGRMGLLHDKRFYGAYNEIADIFANYAQVPSVINISDKGIGVAQDYANVLQESINYNKSLLLLNLLNLANIKYIIIRLNTYLGSNQLSMKEIAQNLEKINRLPKTYEKNSIVIFENPYFLLPYIYPSVENAIIYNNLDSMVNMIEASSSNKLPLFIEKAHLKMDLHILANTQTYPNITFRKINPTKYKVIIDNATRPFFLVFSESYHPKWKAYIKTEIMKRGMGNGEWEIVAKYPKVNVREARHEMKFTPRDISYLFKKPLPEKYHLLVNGYANAWYIDPQKIGKQNFTITLYFKLQSLFYLGLFISGLTLLVSIGYLLYDSFRNRKRR